MKTPRKLLSELIGLFTVMLGTVAAQPSADSAVDKPANALEGLRLRTGIVANQVWHFADLEPDLHKLQLEAAVRKGGGTLSSLLPGGAIAGINGGYFDRVYNPTTWLISGGTELHRQNRTTLGGVVAVKGTRVYVGPLANLPFKKPSFAVQNTPILVNEPGVVAIKQDNGRRASRTTACLADGALHFIILQSGPTTGPTLRETAELLARPKKDGGFGCSAAINLDGGSSTGYWLTPTSKEPYMLPIVPIGYGIAFVPKE